MSASARILEEALYEQVAAEITAGIRREGLWAKALAEAGGSPEFARAAYIKLRAQSLMDEAELRAAAERKEALQRVEMEKQREAEAVNRRVEGIKKQQSAENRAAVKKATNIAGKLVFGSIALVMAISLASVLSLVFQEGSLFMLPMGFIQGAILWWAVKKLREGAR